MSAEKNILRFAWISLVFVFVVVIAGSIVRITGSGMGCPDWPFCYGYVVPPTDEATVAFQPLREYHQGQMIIADDTLWVATEDFTTTSAFDRTDWHKYPKHDYAVFNATHTWIEYINRLATGVLGFPVMLLAVASFVLMIRKKDRTAFFLSLCTLFMLGFEAWLGKLVVDGNLEENSITWHMLGTIAIIGLLITIILRYRTKQETEKPSGNFILFTALLLLLSLVQIVLGTQVREEIDATAERIDDRQTWIGELSSMFEIHRSFAILVTCAALGLFYFNRRLSAPFKVVNLILGVIVMEAASGMILSYAGMPVYLQPVHLWFGLLLFALSFFVLLRSTQGAYPREHPLAG